MQTNMMKSSVFKLLTMISFSFAMHGLAAQETKSASTSAEIKDNTPAKIGVVSTERIFRESNLAKAAQTKIEGEFQKRDKDLQDLAAKLKSLSEKLEKESLTMSETERSRRQRELSDQDKDFQRKQREFREDLNQRRNEELASLTERANRVIKQIAEQEKYDIIFQEAVYASPRIDITEKVLKALNAAK